MAKSFIVTTVVENELVAENTYRMRIACPELTRSFRPGQFCMIRKPGVNDPLLGRSFAIYDLWQDESGAGVDVMYLVVGKATAGFAELLPGQPIEIWGPLGNGFSLDSSVKHLIMLAGGIGQTPFLTLAKETLGKTGTGCNAAPKITLCYGARSKDAFAGLDDFKKLGIDMSLTTVDGTSPDGFDCQQGFATDPMKEIFESEPAEDLFVCACGPRPMLIAAQKLMNQYGVRGQMSLETPMACGLGICFTCVAKIQDDSGAWDYKRTCKEGPVFDASRILWD
ncbi:MAG: dihydroorotate dehydrogenase electron transfer subunit [Thermoguttaceae bacterium]|nr:dihydroorotate dehydrogenase electron transfer subunit [Thermoguttaceae bacterium]